MSFSKKNVLRGLHFQSKNSQAKLITVTYGKILDVAVDLRKIPQLLENIFLSKFLIQMIFLYTFQITLPMVFCVYLKIVQ